MNTLTGHGDTPAGHAGPAGGVRSGTGDTKGVHAGPGRDGPAGAAADAGGPGIPAPPGVTASTAAGSARGGPMNAPASSGGPHVPGRPGAMTSTRAGSGPGSPAGTAPDPGIPAGPGAMTSMRAGSGLGGRASAAASGELAVLAGSGPGSAARSEARPEAGHGRGRGRGGVAGAVAVAGGGRRVPARGRAALRVAVSEFRLLGPVTVHDTAGGTLTPSGPKQRALLATLVLHAGQLLSVDRLVEELWGSAPPANAPNALQAHVARLRRLLPAPGHEWISTLPTGYLLTPGQASTDVARFTRLSGQGRAALPHDPGQAALLLHRALSLWRGPALQDSRHGPLCAAEADRLEEQRLTTLEALYEASLQCGRSAEITAGLERLSADHPLRERLYDLLMLALYRGGRQAEALGVYERARRHLVTTLGIEPGPALRARLDAILNHSPTLTPPPPPPPYRPAAPTGSARPPHAAARARPADLTASDGPPGPGRPADPSDWAGPDTWSGWAAPAGMDSVAGPDELGCPAGPAGSGDLAGELTRLRARIEELAQDQEDLLRRIQREAAAPRRRRPEAIS